MPTVHGALSQCGGATSSSPGLRPLAPSVTNDIGDNEMIPGAMHRSPGICLTAEENPRKPQLGDHLMKELCNQLLPKMGSLSSK